MTGGTRVLLVAAATTLALRLPGIQAFSPLQEPSSRSLHVTSSFQQANPSFDNPDTYLSLSGMFTHDREGERNQPRQSQALFSRVNTNDDDDRSENSRSASNRRASPKLQKPSQPFSIDTFTFNEANVRRTDDIFSLLADIDGPEAGIKEEGQKTDSTRGEESGPTSSGIPGIKAANVLGKNILLATKDLEGLLSVVQKMKRKLEERVETKKKASSSSVKSASESPSSENSFSSSSSTSPSVHRFSFPSKFESPSINDLSSDNDPNNLLESSSSSVSSFSDSSSNDSSSSSLKSPSALMSLLLDTSTLEKIRTAGLTSETEEEFLDHMLEVLTGEETRQGTALTLDPVTIIALLTLAAYLIRAVYQILTVTGRSLEANDMLVPLQMSDLPDAMVQIHNWISASNVAHVRQERSFHPLSSILTIPGNLAAVIKLHREGHRACVRQFLCEQIQERPYREITFTDIIIVGLGYYFGDTDLGTYIDRTLSYHSTCDVVPYGCSPRTLRDAHYLEDLYSRASFKFFDLLAVYNNYL
ncbi:uncharacterized protein [Cherax quadricarinatus]|uniref:uncharacterized protein n=1 Tax=Cherax quadricarinatus TaxID=27406 RepID=UPI00387E8E1F